MIKEYDLSGIITLVHDEDKNTVKIRVNTDTLTDTDIQEIAYSIAELGKQIGAPVDITTTVKDLENQVKENQGKDKK